jgi:DNA polymerase-3 subunit beta
VPASEFPSIEDLQAAQRFAVAQGLLKALIEHTQFAMAQQDVRYYLNGMLLEVKSDSMRAVATDGHRLAMCEVGTNGDVSDVQVIVPRKGVQELQRLLEGGDIPVEVFVGANHIRVACDAFTFTSKLIDGRFPDYERVLPRGGDKVLLTDRDALRQALLRASVLSNEKYRGVRMLLDDGVLRLLASNPEQEEAEEEIEVNYAGGKLEIGFNVGYLLDVLAVIEQAEIEVTFKDGDSSADIRAGGNPGCRYVVMPMRL